MTHCVHCRSARDRSGRGRGAGARGNGHPQANGGYPPNGGYPQPNGGYFVPPSCSTPRIDFATSFGHVPGQGYHSVLS